MRLVGVVNVSINANKAFISVLSRFNFLDKGDGAGIKVSRAVPTYFFCIGAGFPKL